MLAIINCCIVARDHLIPDGVILIKDGILQSVGEARFTEIPERCEIVDAGGLFAGPGLIDEHSHASDAHLYIEEPEAAAANALKNGVTAVMPALYFNMTGPEYLHAMEVIEAASCPNIIGYYMEGPYMNPKYGANKLHNPWAGPIRREEYMPILERAGALARVWALAPEREGILDFVKDALAVNPDAVFAVAHSEATPSRIEALIPYGLKLATHHTDATGSIPVYPEVRGLGVDETVWMRDELYAELIVDSRGIHVDPYMLRLIRKIKGDDRLILISDSVADKGPTPPGYDGVTDICFDFEGEIAGFKETLNVTCRNMMVHTGASVVDVFRYASFNPAKALSLRDRGELRPGLRADVILCDGWMNVKSVFLKGVQVV